MYGCCFPSARKEKKVSTYKKISHIKTRKYTIKEIDKTDLTLKKYQFIHYSSKIEMNIYKWLTINCYKTPKNKIALFHIKNNNSKNQYTLVVSKSSVHDLANFYPFAIDISTQLKINVISYDYSGYGISYGEQNHECVINNLEEIIDFAQTFLEITLDKVIIFGYSIGSIPSVKLCSNKLYRQVRGLVLLSSFSTETKLFGKDRVDSIIINSGIKKENLKDIQCPVLLIHGMKDSIIPFLEVDKMLKFFKYVYTWFPINGDHDNILTKYRMNFICQMNIFINSLNAIKLSRAYSSSFYFKFRFENNNLVLTKNKSSEKDFKIFESGTHYKTCRNEDIFMESVSPFANSEQIVSDDDIIFKNDRKLDINKNDEKEYSIRLKD